MRIGIRPQHLIPGLHLDFFTIQFPPNSKNDWRNIWTHWKGIGYLKGQAFLSLAIRLCSNTDSQIRPRFWSCLTSVLIGALGGQKHINVKGGCVPAWRQPETSNWNGPPFEWALGGYLAASSREAFRSPLAFGQFAGSGRLYDLPNSKISPWMRGGSPVGQ